MVAGLYRLGTVESIDYEADRIRVSVVLDDKGLGRYRNYLEQSASLEESTEF